MLMLPTKYSTGDAKQATKLKTASPKKRLFVFIIGFKQLIK